MWNLPRPGMEPVSPALAGKFLSTVPPRKPPNEFFGQPSNYLEWVQPTLIILGFPGGSVGKKKSACNAGDIGDLGSIPGSGRSLGGGNGNLLQYSCLENSMDRGAWRVTVHGVAKSQRWLKWLSTHAEHIDCLHMLAFQLLESTVNFEVLIFQRPRFQVLNFSEIKIVRRKINNLS